MEDLTGVYQSTLGFTFNPYRKYSGLELLFNKRFSNRWQMLLSYVYSKTTGTINNTGSSYTDIGWGDLRYGPDPNYWINGDGRMTEDPTHQVKLQASYILPLDIRLNAYFTAISGGTWTARRRTSYNSFGGRITVFVEPRGSNRYEMQKNLDMRLEKTFLLAGKYQLGLFFDVFNVFNTSVITSWGNRIGYDWYLDGPESTQGHDLYGLNMPRRARLGIRCMF
jgi:hypothetical protein